MAAQAPGALASTTPFLTARPAGASAYPESSLPATDRLRAAFLGLGLAVLALAATAAAGLAIATGPFHTALGSLA